MKPGERVSGRFTIERHAGTGGMGDVYKALDDVTGQAVALKVLHGPGAKYAARFAREAQVLKELDHPRIVKYIAHGSTDHAELFLAMEWLEGIDLGRRLATRALSVEETLILARRAAEALGAAHDSGVIHRDVKPSNLFLEDGRPSHVRLLDFGIARLTDGTATLTGVTFGTPGYMAPEQARGDRELDARADVFALGCVLFECLTGHAAFAGEHLMAVLAKIVLEDARRVRELRPEVPRELDQLVARMLSKAPPDRPRDGNQVAAELAALGTIVGAPAGSIPPESTSITPGEQRLLCVVLAGLVDIRQSTTTKVSQRGGDLEGPAPDDRPPSDPAELRPTVRSPRAALVGEGPVSSTILERVKLAVTLCDVRLECLAEGSVVATLTGGHSATDQATQAARCALVLRAELPDVPVVVTTGRGVLAGRLPVGEAIDRAARLLRAVVGPEGPPSEGSGSPSTDPRRPIRLDEVTAGLLDARFIVGGDERGLYLRGEREMPDTARTLLGKATPFVGRDRELLTLEAMYAECVAERVARAVVVKGPAGVGKSRLVHELLRKIKERSATSDVVPEIWTARGDPLGAGSPFGIAAQALRRAAGVLDGEPAMVQERKIRARVSRHVAARDQARVTEFLGELARVPFADEDSVQLRAARQDAMLMGDQIRRAWEDLLLSESTAAPVVLVIEDLHWGDLPSIKLVDAALRHLRTDPFLVVALARPEIEEMFPKLWAERSVQELRLPELTRRASERLARHVLGSGVTDERVTKLVEHADGNALYLEELIRAEAEGRSEELPGTVLAMVQTRVEALGAEARWVLRAASVFGEVFWRGGVLSLLGGGASGVQLDKCLQTLVEREVVSVREASKLPNEDEFIFRHALLREAAYAMLTDGDRTLGHKLAGDWLHAIGERDAIVLAEHFERGEEPGRAANWYRRAGEQALEGNDLGAAIDRAERGIACASREGSGQERSTRRSGASAAALTGGEGSPAAPSELVGSLKLLQAEAHRWRGEHAVAEERAVDAMQALARGTARWYAAAGELALASGRLGRYDRLIGLVGDLCAPSSDGQAYRRRTVALVRAAVTLLYAGRFTEAERLVAEVERVEQSVTTLDPGLRAVIQRVRATRAIGAGDPGAYLLGMEGAASSFEQAGDLRNACTARVNVGHAYMELGAYAKAERALWEALTLADRMALPSVKATAKHNLGLALARQGAVDPGRVMEAEAVEAFRVQGDRRLEGASRVYLAFILRLGGKLDAAEAEAKGTAERSSAIPGLRAHALAVLADIRLGQKDAAGAVAAATEAMGLLGELGGIEEGESFIRVVHADALDAAGEHEAARDAIRAARKRLLARAAAISDDRWRTSFLEQVPENARTIELAAAWASGP